MLLASSFVAVALVLCMATVLALFGVTHVSMSGAEAIERDGLAPGIHAPVWSLTDSTGTGVRSPPRSPLQLIMFTDHSLKSFPSVVDGLREVMADERLEIVVLTRRRNELAAPVLRSIGLREARPRARSSRARWRAQRPAGPATDFQPEELPEGL
jgi:hypothetical protein